MMTLASKGFQVAMFWDNFLWFRMGQNGSNNVYSQRAGYSDTGKQV